MKVLVVTNLKGGSAKTTTVVNVAAALAETGSRVLVIDLDSTQGSATRWMGAPGQDARLAEVLVEEDGDLAALVSPSTAFPGVDVIAACPFLTEKRLAHETLPHALLAAAVRKLPPRWDYVLIDTPPSAGLLPVMALAAGTHAVIPVEASAMALSGLATLMPLIEKVRGGLRPELRVAAILPCRVDRTNLSRDVVGALRGQFGATVTEAVIRENVRLAEAPSFFLPVTSYAPQSTGAVDYRAAAAEIARRVA